MPRMPSLLCGALLLLAATLNGADAKATRVKLTVTHSLDTARPGEVITVPYAELRKLIPDILCEHVAVRDASGKLIPAQVTNFSPEQRPAQFNDLVFQHDFAAGEKSAEFTIENARDPVPPFQSRVFARYVPERLDDFAFENDRIAHRIYGPALATPAAGGSLLIGSGIDVWAKRVNYLTVDRWYLRGHDAYHKDTGEGMDLYAVNNTRGCGGSGIWDGKRLYYSGNYKSWKVLANGPIRAVFELSYDYYDAGGVYVSEVKRFTVDAGRNLHRVDSTFKWASKQKSLTAAFGITKHSNAPEVAANAKDGSWLTQWETFEKDGSLGIAIVLDPSANVGGLAEDADNRLVLSAAKNNAAVSYYVGAGWDRSGLFADRAAWETYVSDFAQRLKDPVKVTIALQP